ncbi:MAG: folate-binding protein [Actinomycetota bacterium]|nr:folate-binding protein [Actinomycetota bacterium]
MRWSSPLLQSPGAVDSEGIDSGVAAHYGDPLREQKVLLSGDGFVDLSHRDVIRIDGADRLGWLHSLTTQQLEGLQPSTWVTTLVLSPQGRVEHALTGYDDGTSFWAHVGPGEAAPLVAWLDSMRFMMRVEVHDVTEESAVVARTPDTAELVRRTDLETSVSGSLCGSWAHEALRIARGEPRLGLDTDFRTIPNEVGWIGSAVHLDKGCYRGQETVARVHNLGRPPRRLVMLHLDGSVDRLPASKDEVHQDGRSVGFVGSAARHFELGPIALAVVKRNVPVDVPLTTDGIAAAQEAVVDPEVGLHIRARLQA